MALKDIFVRLKLDSKGFKSGLSSAQKSTTGFGTTLKKVGTIVGSFFAVQQVLKWGKAVFNTVKDFDKASATLAATLGKTKDEISGLTDISIQLGKSTQFTATQVSDLQNELAKLGFSESEIKKSSKAVLDLGQATDTGLGESAKIAGSALRAFNLDASEMERVVSVLAVSTTKSALSMSDFANGLSTVAPVANAFGFSIEDTVALLGKLKDAGFDASSSATATRNILLNLADANGALAKKMGGAVKNFDELIPALINMRESGVDLNSVLEVTDKRSVAAFNQFLQTAEGADTLRDSLIGVEDELEAMVRTKTDNVEGAMGRLSSAWEGVVLTFKDSSGFFKNFFDGLATGLNAISSETLSFGEKLAVMFDFGEPGKASQKLWIEINKPFDDFIGQKLPELQDKYDETIYKLSEAKISGNKGLIYFFEEQKKALDDVVGVAGMTQEQLKTALNSASNNYENAVDRMDAEGTVFYKKQIDLINAYLEKTGEEPEPLKPPAAEETKGLIQELTDRLSDLQESYKSATTIGELQSLTNQIETTKKELEDLITLSEAGLLANAKKSGAAAMPELQSKTSGGIEAADMSVGDISIQFPTEATTEFITQYGYFIDEVNSKTGELVNSFLDINAALQDLGSSVISAGAQALGEALVSGANPLEEGGKAMIGALGDFMVQFGGLMVSTGLAKELNDKLIAIPGAGIPMVLAGTALIAAGSAVAASVAAEDAGFSGSSGATTESNAGVFQMTSSQPGSSSFAGTASNELYGTINIKGADLEIALSNQQNKRNRT